MKLDTARRDRLAQDVLECLRDSAPGSTAALRGSRAERTADEYSDIDVLWEVPDAQFDACAIGVKEILSGVGPVVSVRSDPEFQNSDKRRVLFVRFHGVPLFWRLDLELFAESIERDPDYDVGNPKARGSDWSLTESALMNAVGAVKALLRGNDDEAKQLLLRAYHRVGLSFPGGVPPRASILRLAAEIGSRDPQTKALADEVMELAQEAWEREAGHHP